MRYQIVGGLAAALVLAGAAKADEPTVAQYNAATGKARETLDLYLFAEQQGLAWANGQLANRGAAKLYCQPDDLALGSPDIQKILTAYVAKRTDIDSGKFPMGVVLLNALEEAFPCPKP